MLSRIQQENVRDAIDLYTKTQVAFSKCEMNGLKIDVPYLNDVIACTEERIKGLENALWDTNVGKLWRRKFGQDVFTNRHHLGEVLFSKKENGGLGLEPLAKTEKGAVQVSEDVLDELSAINPEIKEFAEGYIFWMALQKMLTTNLMGIKKGLDPNGFLHPSFLLFSVITYRTSSANINFQNIPHHNQALAAIVRKCFIPRAPDRHIVELDYSGAEVRANASINHDPTLVQSVTDGLDFHKAVASLAYKLPESAITKPLRQSVKGDFTFAAFYGSYWLKIATALWKTICFGGLTLADGTPLKEHLANEGITELGGEADKIDPRPGTYFYHIKEAEKHFWGDLFRVYAKWKDKAWKDYQENTYVDTMTGFRCKGIFSKNLVTNIPGQSSASHCLLWSFCKLTQAIELRGWKTKLCGQIHDSIVADVPHDELDDFLRLANELMTKKLTDSFKWIAVPMEIEADVAPMGKSWWEKAGYPIP